MKTFKRKQLFLATLVASSATVTGNVALAQDNSVLDDSRLEEVFVFAESQIFGNNVVSDTMKERESPMTSVNALIDNLPGVSIHEGDTYGFDDWSTTIALRGFQSNLDEQQVGTTLDGLPNGNSNYGGGAKANRYLDPENLDTVEVSQGTADIASRSLEALGGTINFKTNDPLQESRVRAQASFGDHDAQRVYLRYDTGEIFGNTRAYVSLSNQTASDWVNGAAENERDHIAAKFVTDFDRMTISGYLSYDDIHEDNYQRLFSPTEFASDADWDRLTDIWTGIPYVDQVYRRGWSTLRENLFGYVRGDFEFNDGLNISANLYHHTNEGRGDWIPPYLVDVVADNGGPESEVLGGTSINGGPALGRIFFVDGNGNALSPIPGCVSSITFPYGGAGAEYDPACYPAGAIPVQSYRHTNYEKDRTGITVDAEWISEIRGMDNTFRGGIWYEDQERFESRTWQKITDTRVGIAFDSLPYWTQYSRDYPQETLKWYLENSIDVNGIIVSFGGKQFLVDVERKDNFGQSTNVSIDSDSDVLFSGGALWHTPIDGLEIFAGYAENFKAISDLILERPDSDLSGIEPETAENIEIGARYRGDRMFLTATYFDADFQNRIIFLSPESEAGPNYLIGTTGTYFNAGGIESSGFELTADVRINDNWSLYAMYTYNDSTYVGTGDSLVDSGLGIRPGNSVTGIPENQYVVSLDYQRDNVMAGLSTKVTGDRYVNLGNTWEAEQYTTTDAYLTYTGESGVGEFSGWSISLLVNNLTDESYLGGISGGGAWIGAPRTISASFTVDM